MEYSYLKFMHIFYCKPKGVAEQNHLNLKVGDLN